MNILIAGGSGFIGKELVKKLSKTHQVTVLGRNISKLKTCFPDKKNIITWDDLHSHDACIYDLIINLSGSNIGEKRWTASVKKQLIQSRVHSNERLIHWLEHYQASPRFFCANAVGVYGLQQENDTTAFDEDTPIDFHNKKDFLQKISIAWLASLQPAVDKGLQVTTLHFGVVLQKGQGMLKKLELPFSLGLGNTLGSGEQYLSWIHYKDAINAILLLIENTDVSGRVNITAPNPIKQKHFACALAKALHRPLFLRMPAMMVRAIFGEMGECLLLKGQNVVPKKLQALGFKFQYPTIEQALTQEYK